MHLRHHTKRGQTMYGQEANLREQIIEEYKDDLTKLLRYLPFMEKKMTVSKVTMAQIRLAQPLLFITYALRYRAFYQEDSYRCGT